MGLTGFIPVKSSQIPGPPQKRQLLWGKISRYTFLCTGFLLYIGMQPFLFLEQALAGTL